MVRHRDFIFGITMLIRPSLAHLVYQPKSLIQSCFVRRRRWCRRRCPASELVLASSVHNSPWHRIIHRNLAAILVFFFHLLFCHTDSHRDFILHILMYIFFTFVHTRNNATVTYFLKFMTIFLKFIYSLPLTRALTCTPLRL